MADSTKLDLLLATVDASAIERTIREAYRIGKEDGLAEGMEKVRSNVLSAIGVGGAGGAPVSFAGGALGRAAAFYGGGPPLSDDESAKRAPKGLTRQVIKAILREDPGLSTALVQSNAVAIDQRLSEKTVYNELNRERGHIYQQERGGWYLLPSFDIAEAKAEVIAQTA